MKKSILIPLLLLATSLNSLAETAIPAELKSWIPWVLEGYEKSQCPAINQTDYNNQDNHICAWSSALQLDIASQNATFSQKWQVLDPTFVPLPGDSINWPQNVKVNKQLYAVIDFNGYPAIELKVGNYTLTGEFNWKSLPDSISVPAQTALVNLTVEQQKVAFPKIENRELWFQNIEMDKQQQDAVELSVARKLTDGAFLKLETYLDLSVSGKMREVILGKVLPEGFELIEINAEFPVYIDSQGLLHAKLKPGDWQLMVVAYASATHLQWQRPAVSHHWPPQEIWLFQADEKIRLGKLSGATMIDSEQATLPAQWYQLPSYLMNVGDTLSYDIQHRGMPLQLENKLSLERDLWLSFDNQSFNFVDQLSGSMIKDWRLSMSSPFQLESAQDNDGAILITTTATNESGIETRYPEVDIEARGMLAAQSSLPISGWSQDFDKVSIRLNLPPGHELFAVMGADRVSQSWLSNWSIWSSFIVLLASIVAGRLVSIQAGILTALTLILIYQQPSAPIVAMLNLLLAHGMRKHLNFAAIKSIVLFYWRLSVAIALGCILFFVASQLRNVLHPQLERNNSATLIENFNARPDVFNMLPDDEAYKSSSPVEKIVVTGSRLRDKDLLMERYQSDALMQAGSGIPNWQWKQYFINWSSPVASEQQFEIIILDKNTNRVLKSIGIVLLIAWLYLLVKQSLHAVASRLPMRTAAMVIGLVFLFPGYVPESSASDLPNQELLNELRNRVLQPPPCAPQCSSINQLTVITSGKTLNLDFEVHASVDAIIALPRSEFWRPEKLTLEQKELSSMYKKDGWIYVAIPKGISNLNVIGQLASIDELQLQFNQIPKRIELSASKDWQIIGVQQHRLTGNSLAFIATEPQASEDNQQVSRYLAKPIVKVTRRISIDQIWRIDTQVERIAPANGSITVQIPILPGEFVTTSNMSVTDNRVSVTIAAGEQKTNWRSTLQRQPEITLTADTDPSVIEEWAVMVSPAWHSELSGVPIILQQQDPVDYYSYHFTPYPGETLIMNSIRPAAVKGQVLAIDAADLTVEQGTRTATLELEMQYRSTRGGEHSIDLPANYQLKQVKVDNQIVNLQPANNALTLPISPGEHSVIISMRSDQTPGLMFSSPQFNLNAPVSNINTVVKMNKQRWILWADGPTLGPAILYWGELLVFILIAVLLSRLSFSPLSWLSWIILGLGLSLNNWAILMLVAAWFAAITASTYRSNKMKTSSYNAAQMGLYFLSVITILSLIAVVPISLLGTPSMGIEGNMSSSYQLIWFADKSTGLLPEVSIFTAPIWFYKGLMLAWVIWLSFALVSWTKWAWTKLGSQGYWQKAPVIVSSKE
ncbi:hypothetical protein [Aliiglaciecola sp. LCG003]|uniref:hypothetical protein n=1 Tax=Aliiglaciecola sp. LCG003 TaxID=3053655 RepID=UPI002572A895|nr:hypothetical protein [Aliiglaciecola sp. LCG003]WJG09618.1 hypothetical protein QR722_00855 [Aliiglaciecola sp. LCG003]